MKYIELRICTPTKEIITTTLINTSSIIRVDNTNPTTIYLKEFDYKLNVIECYNYIKYELTKKENEIQSRMQKSKI